MDTVTLNTLEYVQMGNYNDVKVPQLPSFQKENDCFGAKTTNSANFDIPAYHHPRRQSTPGQLFLNLDEQPFNFYRPPQIKYQAIAPLMKTSPTTLYNNSEFRSRLHSAPSVVQQPLPMRKSSLLNVVNSVYFEIPSKRIIEGSDNLMSSLNVATPTNQFIDSPDMNSFITSFKGATFSKDEQSKLTVDFEDPLLLLQFMSPKSRNYSYNKTICPPISKKLKVDRNDSYSPYSLFNLPSSDDFSRIEDEFLDAVYRKQHQVPTSSPDIFGNHNLPTTPSSRQTGISKPATPKSPMTPRIPYKGRFGTNPVCGSCHTSRTPYWRDSWSNKFILCNACGLRYSKFKKFCASCNYIPRKEEKHQCNCTNCGIPWSIKT